MNLKSALLIGFALISAASEARVFSYKDAGLSVLLRGTGGMSSVSDAPFGQSSGVDTTMDDQSKYQYGGELGMVLALNDKTNLRLGAEVMKHHPVRGSGKNPAEQERFELESSTFVFNPNLAFEFLFKQGQSSRFFVQLGVGYAMVDVENRYDMNSTGTAELAVDDFNEKMSGSAPSYMAGVGMEFQALDNVALSFEAGYRYCKIAELKYTGDFNSIVAPTGTHKGDPALNHDGSQRELDLGGAFVGAALRFYLHFL
jgi:opacity protein-like surface antigen